MQLATNLGWGVKRGFQAKEVLEHFDVVLFDGEVNGGHRLSFLRALHCALLVNYYYLLSRRDLYDQLTAVAQMYGCINEIPPQLLVCAQYSLR